MHDYDPDEDPPDYSNDPDVLKLCEDCADDDQRYDVVAGPIEWAVPTPYYCDDCGEAVPTGANTYEAFARR